MAALAVVMWKKPQHSLILYSSHCCFIQFQRLEQDSMISRRSEDMAGQELVVLVEEQPPYVQFSKAESSILICLYRVVQ